MLETYILSNRQQRTQLLQMDTQPIIISLSDVEDQINILNAILTEKYSKLLDEMKRFQEEKAGFDATNKVLMTFRDPIKLNVGGTIFTTSRATLLKEDSMLRAMFSGRHQLEKGEDGSYFIDRDPKYFRSILNYLRDGEFELEADNVNRRELLREAEFYCLPSLIEQLKPYDLCFDPNRKGPKVIVNGFTASYTSGGGLSDYQSAFTRSFSKGIHSCSIQWIGDDILVGLAGGSVDGASLSGVYAQTGAMVVYSSNGKIYGDATTSGKSLAAFSPGSTITMELDCEQRNFSWIINNTRYTESLHINIQAPFSFCVDLHKSTATITALN